LSTLAQFRTVVADELGLDNDSATEQPDIDIWVNKGVVRVLTDTHCYVTATSVTASSLTAVGSTGDYLIPTTFLEIVDMFITSGGTNYRLERLTVPDLVERRRVSNPIGSPTMCYALAGANLLMFWPNPSSADVLSVYNVPIPTALSATGDDPSVAANGGIPIQLHEAIEFYACFKGASYDDDQSSAQGQRYHDLYDREITRYTKLIRRRGGQRNPRAVVNDTKRRRAFHTNDVYTSGG
jgi:hypothetical protein